MFAVNLSHMKDFSINKIVLLFPLLYPQAAHRGPDFTLRHARNTVFWSGLTLQVKDMCTNCPKSATHTQQHPREPLQPYPVPTLPWQLVSQEHLWRQNHNLHEKPVRVRRNSISDIYLFSSLPFSVCYVLKSRICIVHLLSVFNFLL